VNNTTGTKMKGGACTKKVEREHPDWDASAIAVVAAKSSNCHLEKPMSLTDDVICTIAVEIKKRFNGKRLTKHPGWDAVILQITFGVSPQNSAIIRVLTKIIQITTRYQMRRPS
jgi:hypothetical protein